jgi:hypothetical protein
MFDQNLTSDPAVIAHSIEVKFQKGRQTIMLDIIPLVGPAHGIIASTTLTFSFCVRSEKPGAVITHSILEATLRLDGIIKYFNT